MAEKPWWKAEQEIPETPLIPPSEKNKSPCVRDVHPGE